MTVESSDFTLLDAWIAGDANSATTLFERYFGPLYAFFRNKVSEGIDDLVQDTFVELLRGRAKFRQAGNFRSYLFGTARHVLLKELRHRHRGAKMIEFGETSIAALEPTPSGVIMRTQQERILSQALRRLPLDDQILFELYEWEKLDARDVGQVLGISEPAVRSRLHRAKARLQEEVRAVAESPELFRSTIEGLDSWAAALRLTFRPPER